MPDDDTYRAMLCDGARFAATRTWVGPSAVQRHVRVGFVTASRMVHDLQDAGIIGPPTATGRQPVTAGYAQLESFIREHGGDRVPKLVKTAGGAVVPLRPELCEPHTKSPSGYGAFSDWMEEMEQTHVQRQCAGCGLWAVWILKEDSVA